MSAEKPATSAGLPQLLLQCLGLADDFFSTPAGHRSDLRQK